LGGPDHPDPGHDKPGRSTLISLAVLLAATGLNADIPMTMLKLVGFSANVQRPSKTRALVEAVGQRIGRLRATRFEMHDFVDAGPGIAAFSRNGLTPSAEAVISAIETADALVVGTPVYKGSYTGLFKHLFDFVDPAALVGKPVILSATGGGPRHALVVEHSLRPLFGFFSAHTIPSAVYGSDADFRDGILVDEGVKARIRDAANQLAELLQARAARTSAPEAGSPVSAFASAG
jgi:FMN reductase